MTSLLSTREFWVTIFTLFVIVIGQFVPGFKLDIANLVSLVLIMATYLLGIAVDPGPGGWKGVIQSRKFLAAFVGAVLIFLDAFHVVLPADLTAEMLVSLAAIISALIANFAMQPKPDPEPEPELDTEDQEALNSRLEVISSQESK